MGCSPSSEKRKRIETVQELTIAPSLFIKVNPHRFLDVYKAGRVLGSGAYGEVLICKHIASGNSRAVKVFTRRELTEVMQRMIVQELEILKQLDHPNIIRVYESFIDTDFYYIVMEQCTGGELFDEIIKANRLDEVRSASIIRQLLSAIAYMHDKGLAHRDLKPENILFEEKPSTTLVKLIDFGTAVKVVPGKSLKGSMGSAYYVAPEVLTGSYGLACDMWSLGVVTYVLLAGFAPFDGDTDREILAKVKAGQYSFENKRWSEISEEAKDFIRKLLVNQTDRLTAHQALQHPWILNKAKQPKPSVANVQKMLQQISTESNENKLLHAVKLFITSQLMSAADSKEAREVFTALDVNGDGRLSREELIQGYTQILGENAEVFVDELMKTVDSDGSGFVDYTEFLRVTLDQKKMMSEENLKTAFNFFDTDGNGTITAKELKAVLGGKDDSANEVWTELIHGVDANGDALIDLEEFKALIMHCASS